MTEHPKMRRVKPIDIEQLATGDVGKAGKVHVGTAADRDDAHKLPHSMQPRTAADIVDVIDYQCTLWALGNELRGLAWILDLVDDHSENRPDFRNGLGPARNAYDGAIGAIAQRANQVCELSDDPELWDRLRRSGDAR